MHDAVSNARRRNLRTITRTAFALALTLALSASTANGGTKEPEPQRPGVTEPYVAKGRVTDSLGNPMKGIAVFADNTAYYDMTIYGVQVANLAVTKYAVSARYLAAIGEPENLLIRVRDMGSSGPFVNADFGNDGYGYLQMELEVRLP